MSKDSIECSEDGLLRLWLEADDDLKRFVLDKTFFDRYGYLRPSPPTRREDIKAIIRRFKGIFTREGITDHEELGYYHAVVAAALIQKLSYTLHLVEPDTIIKIYEESGVWEEQVNE